MNDEERAGRLLDRYRRNAVLLHQPYPPPSDEDRHSHVGGLPRMPAHLAWPRTSDGVPLHFLAQMNCSELPRTGPLPDRGVLFFFGRDDDEQIWSDGGPAHDDCRVLFAPEADPATAPRPAPEDLPPIGGLYPRPYARPFLRQGEPGPNVHPRWPVSPLAMPSWPSFEALPEADIDAVGQGFFANVSRLFRNRSEAALGFLARRHEFADAYEAAYERRCRDAFFAATGLRDPGVDEHRVARRDAIAVALWGRDADPERFPTRWLDVDLFARVARALGDSLEFTVPGAVAQAEEWIVRADGEAPSASVPIEDREAFRRWVNGWKDLESPLPFHPDAASLMLTASVQAVRLDVSTPDMLASPRVYETVAPLLTARAGEEFAHMLGHARSSQHPRAADDPVVCLLHLTSASPVAWMFGDMGDCTFWIRPEDLARRRFDRAWATLEGH